MVGKCIPREGTETFVFFYIKMQKKKKEEEEARNVKSTSGCD